MIWDLSPHSARNVRVKACRNIVPRIPWNQRRPGERIMPVSMSSTGLFSFSNWKQKISETCNARNLFLMSFLYQFKVYLSCLALFPYYPSKLIRHYLVLISNKIMIHQTLRNGFTLITFKAKKYLWKSHNKEIMECRKLLTGSIDFSGNIYLLLPLFFSSQPVLPHIPLVLHQGTSHNLKY